MQLSRATRYAVEALVHLAREGDGKIVPSHEVARAEGIPERFMLKCLKPLVSARLLLSLRGPNGGYRLSRPPGKITILEVVEAVEGPLMHRGDFGNGKGDAGRLEETFEKATAAARKELGRVTLADLARKKGK
jgi:Rrf2 family protein